MYKAKFVLLSCLAGICLTIGATHLGQPVPTFAPWLIDIGLCSILLMTIQTMGEPSHLHLFKVHTVLTSLFMSTCGCLWAEKLFYRWQAHVPLFNMESGWLLFMAIILGVDLLHIKETDFTPKPTS